MTIYTSMSMTPLLWVPILLYFVFISTIVTIVWIYVEFCELCTSFSYLVWPTALDKLSHTVPLWFLVHKMNVTSSDPRNYFFIFGKENPKYIQGNCCKYIHEIKIPFATLGTFPPPHPPLPWSSFFFIKTIPFSLNFVCEALNTSLIIQWMIFAKVQEVL